MMRRGFVIGSLVLEAVLVCSPVPVHAAERGALPPYPLEVRFQGLIAYVPTPQGIWALLVNADYDPTQHNACDLPACADSSQAEVTDFYPRHVAALRFSGATATLNGGALGGIVPVLLLKGKDLRFDTGKHGQPVANLEKLAGVPIMQQALLGVPGAPHDFSSFNVIDARYLTSDSEKAMKEHWLGARLLVDFGDSITGAERPCPKKLKYGWFSPGEGSANCHGGSPLAEIVTVSQAQVVQPVRIRLGADELVLTPMVPGGKVSIEILNVMPDILVDQYYDVCNEGSEHLRSFQWFFRLLQSPPETCQQNYYPCLKDPQAGGDACPVFGGRAPADREWPH